MVMELLHPAPPGFDGVANAFAMAKHLPTTRRLEVQVGLVHAGVLFATGQLDGFRQVSLFSEHVRQLGWREHLLGGDDNMHGCDVVFSLPDPGERDADPSFIRRPAVELWPRQEEHAER